MRQQHVDRAAGLRIAGLGGCVRYRRGPHQYTKGIEALHDVVAYLEPTWHVQAT